MLDHLGEVIFHSLVAALAAEALVRLWELDDASTRLAIRLVVIGLAVLGWPILELVAPFRHAPWFEDRYALFASRRWGGLDVLGASLMAWWVGAWTLIASALFAVDLVPWARGRGRSRRLYGSTVSAPARVEQTLAELCTRMALARPRLTFVDSAVPLMLCRGIRRPELVLSSGTSELLDESELRAAMAHELAHVGRRDVRLGWGLLIARTLGLFNPAVQLLARSATGEAERRADDAAVATTGDRLALASALVKIFEARAGARDGSPGGWQTMVYRSHERHVRARCRRLLDGRAGTVPSWPRTRVAAAGAMLLLLVFLVT